MTRPRVPPRASPRASVVIVSQQRPVFLRRCLQSLRNQTRDNFEVVVVADRLAPDFAGQVRFHRFETANIAEARNIGIAMAAGDLVAFCDDDAIPDPPWLERLLAPFDDPAIHASGGFTRGRNGISLQWGAMRFDRAGEDLPLALPPATRLQAGTPFHRFDPDPQNPVKLVGTNMAFRRKALQTIGGFDAAFRFYLDDADVKLRLDAAGFAAALVPSAQVHHLFAPGPRRTPDRIPTDLFEIGASKACFVTRHLAEGREQALRTFVNAQMRRLRQRYALGLAETTRLIASLTEGMKAGRTRAQQTGLPEMPRDFLPFATVTGPHVVVLARNRNRKRAARLAAALVDSGCRVSVLHLRPTPHYFQTRFEGGFWSHSGGVWGKADRREPLLQFTTYTQRFRKEIARISKVYDVDFIAHPETGNFMPKLDCLAPLSGHSVEQWASM